MKVSSKNIMFFLGGTTIGALGGIFGVKKHYEAKYKAYADETIAEMREVMLKARYKVPGFEEEIYDRDEDVILSEENDAREFLEAARPNDVSERLQMNHEATNYAAIYGTLHSNGKSVNLETHMFGALKEETKDEEEEYIDPFPDNDYAANRPPINKMRKPRLISAVKAHDLPGEIEIQTLYFYTEDEVVADEDTEERIDDYPLILGDCLEKYDFANSSERTIYVLNEELDTCYTVIKVDGSYEDTH